jgi:16S rRNA processing protein RimM
MQSKKLGVVSKLLETGANDVMVIQGDNQILIPFVMHEVIKEVDLSEGRIVVDWEWVD